MVDEKLELESQDHIKGKNQIKIVNEVEIGLIVRIPV